MIRIVAYVASLVVFLALDAVWLTVMNERLYRPVLGDMLAPRLNVPAAVAFYLIYLVGLTVLATAPALKEGSAARALVNGAVFGLVAYATYDLTNQATLRAWSIRLTLADMGWGAVASAVAAFAGFYAARLISR
jgi:uncharacterized membrane protein